MDDGNTAIVNNVCVGDRDRATASNVSMGDGNTVIFNNISVMQSQ